MTKTQVKTLKRFCILQYIDAGLDTVEATETGSEKDTCKHPFWRQISVGVRLSVDKRISKRKRIYSTFT